MDRTKEVPENPLAFPSGNYAAGPDGYYRTNAAAEEGMTLRDWFAGKVLPEVARSRGEGPSWAWSMDEIAADAYAMADAMLAARKDQQP